MLDFSNVAGKLLIANPHAMHQENVFHKSLIYIAAHEPEGAVGLIINHPIKKLSTNKLFSKMTESINFSELNLDVYLGGPIELGRGFFLHSSEYDKDLLFKGEQLSISSNLQILEDMGKNIGPQKAIFTVGYTGWSKGQMEEELENNLWLPAELDIDLVFADDHDNKWQTCLDRTGIKQEGFLPYIAKS